MTKSEKYNVAISKETMWDYEVLIEHMQKTFPFIPETLWRLKCDLREILLYGCFKHNILNKKIQQAPDHTIVYCPKCNPEYEKEASP